MFRQHSVLLRAARLAALALACAAITACPLRKADPPHVIRVPVRQYVDIPAELTKPCPIAEGTLAQALEVARLRKEALEGCANADKAAIRKLSGKLVDDTKDAAP